MILSDMTEMTFFNAFFIPSSFYEAFLTDEVPDTTIEALHDTTMETSLYQLYDGM